MSPSNRKGKGKAQDRSSDEVQTHDSVQEMDNVHSDSSTYPADPTGPLMLVVFDRNDKPAHTHNVAVPDMAHFSFKSYLLAKQVGAVTAGGGPLHPFRWFCPLERGWNPADRFIDLRRLGYILILRKESVNEGRCMGLMDWMIAAMKAALDQDKELDISLPSSPTTSPPPSSFPSSLSTVASSSSQPSSQPTLASIATSSGLKRKLNSKKYISPYLEEQQQQMKLEDESDEEFDRKRKRAKTTLNTNSESGSQSNPISIL
ncbi:hypothetical protein MVEN_00467400 [Mycena venus]|uniref:Uncharacterized protein n=1 Tax=Mycena venus TaxID=2733690 RepID=A0A8H7DAT3_9AGAR|nr:hypothetical protein MVEN_00467400 [Mycena venus]